MIAVSLDLILMGTFSDVALVEGTRLRAVLSAVDPPSGAGGGGSSRLLRARSKLSVLRGWEAPEVRG